MFIVSRICLPVISVLFLLALSVPVNAQDGEFSRPKAPDVLPVYRIVLHEDVLHGVSWFMKEWSPATTVVVLPRPKYCLLRIPIVDSRKMSYLVFDGSVEFPPLWGMSKDSIYWVWSSGLTRGSSGTLAKCTKEQAEVDGGLFATFDAHVTGLSPLQFFLMEPPYISRAGTAPPVHDLVIGDMGKIQLYVQDDRNLACWTLNEKQHWKKMKSMKSIRQGHFI